MTARQTPESFWKKVERKPNGCWEWQGSLNSTGYGNVAWSGKRYTAHRTAAWLVGMIKDPAAPKNRRGSGFVLHRCDNRLCCNPSHFFLGTFGDNQKDAYTKERRTQPKGQHHVNAKLTDAQARAIRRLYSKGAVQTKLAAFYGVSQRVISLIVRGEAYK